MFSLDSLINSSPQIRDYFIKHTQTPEQSFKLASDLLIESITKKITLQKTQPILILNQPSKQVKSPKTHHNVAYVKHNRFLSPSQKKQVTPKVTEIIPLSPQKVFIYGKPKVKLDQGYGCPLHEQNCEQYGQNQDDSQIYPLQQKNSKSQDYTQELPHQYEEYLSPKSKLNKKTQKKNMDINKTITTIRSPKNKNNRGTQNRISSQNQLGNNRIRIKDSENLAKVESKIKDLIQRDKKNRELEKQVELQRQQILQIQERQNRLFLMQEYQKKIINQDMDNQESQENEVWKIKTSLSPSNQNMEENISQGSQIESSQYEFMPGYHGHLNRQQRNECYECEIQRLKMRKIKAQMDMKTIGKEEKKRMMLKSMVRQHGGRGFVGQQKSFEQLSSSHNSIRIS